MSLAEPDKITVVRDNWGVHFDLPPLPPQPEAGRLLMQGFLWILASVTITLGLVALMIHFSRITGLALFGIITVLLFGYSFGIGNLRLGLLARWGPRLQVRINQRSLRVLAQKFHYWPLSRIYLVNLDRLLLVRYENQPDDRAADQPDRPTLLWAQTWSQAPQVLLNGYSRKIITEAADILAEECTAALAAQKNLARPHEVKVIVLTDSDQIPLTVEQPPTSNSVLERHGAGITIHVKGTPTENQRQVRFGLTIAFVAVLGLCGLIAIIALWVNLGALWGIMTLVAVPVILTVIWKASQARTRPRDIGTIDVTNGRLTISMRGLGMTWRFHWDKSEIAGVEVKEIRESARLKIMSRGLRRKSFFGECQEDELHWMARVLRQTLGL